MNIEIKNLLNQLYNACDAIDNTDIGLKNIGNGKTTLRDILKLDIASFTMYLSASSGRVEWQEANYIGEILDMNLNAEAVSQVIKDQNFYSTEFENKIPLSLQIFVKIDQTLSNMLNGQKVSETLVGIFKMIGMDLISCDNNVTQNERNDINIYISNLEKYVQNELGTINNNNFVKSTTPNNTLKSNYEFLKKINK